MPREEQVTTTIEHLLVDLNRCINDLHIHKDDLSLRELKFAYKSLQKLEEVIFTPVTHQSTYNSESNCKLIAFYYLLYQITSCSRFVTNSTNIEVFSSRLRQELQEILHRK